MSIESLPYSRSIFLEKLVPQFVREEFPIFIKFMKQYYDFLDRKGSTLVAVRVTNSGENYSNSPTVSLEVLNDSGTYVADTLGATFSAYVQNGRIEKILVTNYGSGYSTDATYRITITDATGTGASATPYIVPEIGQVNYAAKSLQFSRDIDTEFPVLYEFLRKEYIPNIPKNLYVGTEPEKFIKLIRQYYTSTGVENSFKFLYRILYNTEPLFYYPKVDMLRVSDGRYQIDNILNIIPSSPYSTLDDLEAFKEKYLGKRIFCSVCKVTAIIERVEAYSENGHKLSLYLSNINGNFMNMVGEIVSNFPITGKAETIGTTTYKTVGATGFSFYTTDGYYLGDEGQPSSSKKIQDSFYYQDFSYEVAALESGILEYGTLIEKLVHPAGLKYFVRYITEDIANLNPVVNFASSDVVTWSDIDTLVNFSVTSKNLGPTYFDIDKYADNSLPKYVDEYLTPRENADNSNKLFYLSNNDNERYNPLIGSTPAHYYLWNRLYIMSGPGVGEFRKIVAFDGATGVIEYEYPFLTPPTTSSTYYIHPDFYGASGATGYYNGYVESFEVLYGGTGFNTADIIVTVDEPPGVITEAQIAGSTSAVVAGASAVISSGTITGLTVTNGGIGYFKSPNVSVSSSSNPDEIAVISAHINDISNSNYYGNYSEYGGVILKSTSLREKFINAFGFCELGESEDYIDNIILGATGLGYFVPPRINFRYGNIGATSFAQATANIDANGSINEITFGATGSGYVYAPTVFIDPVTVPSGEIVYQPTTGASGILEYYDRDNDNLYILKDSQSVNFDDSDIVFNGATCVINNVIGTYNTTGKSINTLPESEIVIIKQ